MGWNTCIFTMLWEEELCLQYAQHTLSNPKYRIRPGSLYYYSLELSLKRLLFAKPLVWSQAHQMLCLLCNLCRYIRARATTQYLDTEKNLSPLSIPLNGNSMMLQKLWHLSLQESQGSLQPDSLFWCCECFGRKQRENSSENCSKRQTCLCQIVNAGIKRHQSFKQALNTVLEGFGIYKWVRQGQNGLNFRKISFYFRRVESSVRDRVSKRNSLQNEE